MEERRYGGFWKRLLAFMIDKTIIYALSLNISLIILLAAGIGNDVMSIIQAPPEKLSRGIGAFAAVSTLLSILIDMTYFTWFTGVSGQTPGKMLMRLRVIAASGDAITTGTAFLRWTGCIVSGVAFFLGFLWIPFDRKKQGWHDKIAMTVVVHVPIPTAEKNAIQIVPDEKALDKPGEIL